MNRYEPGARPSAIAKASVRSFEGLPDFTVSRCEPDGLHKRNVVSHGLGTICRAHFYYTPDLEQKNHDTQNFADEELDKCTSGPGGAGRVPVQDVSIVQCDTRIESF